MEKKKASYPLLWENETNLANSREEVTVTEISEYSDSNYTLRQNLVLYSQRGKKASVNCSTSQIHVESTFKSVLVHSCTIAPCNTDLADEAACSRSDCVTVYLQYRCAILTQASQGVGLSNAGLRLVTTGGLPKNAVLQHVHSHMDWA